MVLLPLVAIGVGIRYWVADGWGPNTWGPFLIAGAYFIVYRLWQWYDNR